jgi:serine/threonine-protein kinase
LCKSFRSAFSFSGRDVEVREIGRDLHVEVVLEGSFRLAKNRMRITVQLVSAQSGYHVWSQRYDRQLSQTFELKGDIALEIVEALEITLPGPERARVSKRDTENAKAHQLYLQGCFHTGTFTAEGFRSGIECLNQAIAADPNYALAYAELARAYHRISHVHLRPAESFMKVKAAAERALELDGDLAEAHSLLAVVAANYYRVPKDAEEGFKRALELPPYNSPIHQRYGSFLMTQGRLAAAVAEFCKAKQLDPLCPILNVLLSATYYFAREPLPALKHAREAILQNESLWYGYWNAALAR